MAHILIVDDELAQLQMMAEALELAGHDATTATDGVEALNLVGTKPFAMAFVDLYMPGMDGLQAIPKLLFQVPTLRVVAVSGGLYGGKGTDLLRVAAGLGAVRVLQKPFSIAELVALVDELISQPTEPHAEDRPGDDV